MIIDLPYKFDPRPYQQKAIDAFFKSGRRNMILIWARRHGKDRTSFNILVAEALRNVGLYYYAYPNRQQAKIAIWEGVMNDGTKFMDHIPKNAVKRILKHELLIELINGSIIRLVGIDYYDHFVGTNPRGIVFSEYAVASPIAYSLMRPVLNENKGFAIFPYTPRGHNHGFDLYNINKDNPKWYCSYLTCAECVDQQENRYFTVEQEEEERRSGMSENLIQQEYYCDFEATLEGAIFTIQFAKAKAENRIRDFHIDRTLPVYTFWDIGFRDATSIWFVQLDKNGYYKLIYYYEMCGQPMTYYVPKVFEIGRNLGITFGGHYAPHDIVKHDYNIGQTHREFAESLGLHFNEPVKRMATKEDGIERSRVRFDKVILHKTNCENGINALKSYVRLQSKDGKEYGKPNHNWASHAADAFAIFSFVDIGSQSQYSTVINSTAISW